RLGTLAENVSEELDSLGPRPEAQAGPVVLRRRPGARARPGATSADHIRVIPEIDAVRRRGQGPAGRVAGLWGFRAQCIRDGRPLLLDTLRRIPQRLTEAAEGGRATHARVVDDGRATFAGRAFAEQRPDDQQAGPGSEPRQRPHSQDPPENETPKMAGRKPD